ncbi:MAG: EAL domain-containing protein [Gammaproteobacteria bacterium]
MNILIVDDNQPNRYLLERLLPANGYRVRSASDGAEALERLSEQSFDLVVSDILMPRMDGFQLCRAVKGDSRYRRIPFVFYTATYTDPRDEAFALSLGAARFIIKPQEPEHFIDMLREVIKQRVAGELATPQVPLNDDIVHLKEYNARLVRKLEDKMLQLESQKERYLVTLASIGEGVITTDVEGRISLLNHQAERLTGWSEAEVQGLPLQQVLKIIRAHQPAADEPLARLLAEDRLGALCTAVDEHAILLRRDQEALAISVSATPIRNNGGKLYGAVFVLRDISDKREMVKRMTYQATHDALTGLINRTELEHRLERILSANASDAQHALLYLDLDQFKVVNDTCGHAAGDELLRQITMQLRSKVRKRDTLARFGGDEFGVLLEYCTVTQALRIADDLRGAVSDFRFVWQDRTFAIGVSIGLVPIPAAANSLTQVLMAADSACYAAKGRGRNRVHVYKPDDGELALRHSEMQWVPRIHRALAEGRFCLYEQPIAPLGELGAECEHAEVLIRLVNEDGGLVPAGAFIPAAERYGLIQSLDRWVVRQVLAVLRARGPDQARVRFAINLSGPSLGDEAFLEFVLGELDRCDGEPPRLCFEITETAAVADLSNALRFMGALSARGCCFALDDFGSGLASFSYLKSLPVDCLKIDGGFVKNMVTDQIDRAMVEAIHRVGSVMGITTIAECVESPTTLERLKAIGVNYAQGYGIAMPRPLQ